MKPVVIYTSRYGSTAKAAAQLAQRMGADLVDVTKKKPDLNNYGTVIIGGPIFAGSLPASLKKFCTENQAALLSKRLGLFICCSREGQEAQDQLMSAFPSELNSHAFARVVLGGAVIIEKHNFLIKAVLKKVGLKESFSRLDVAAIEALAGAAQA